MKWRDKLVYSMLVALLSCGATALVGCGPPDGPSPAANDGETDNDGQQDDQSEDQDNQQNDGNSTQTNDDPSNDGENQTNDGDNQDNDGDNQTNDGDNQDNDGDNQDNDENNQDNGDPDEPPCLEVIGGDELDFGLAAVGETTTDHLTLRNCAFETDLVVDDIEVTDSDDVFAIDDAALPDDLGDTDHEVDPQQVLTVPVEYTPDGETSHQGELQIDSNDAVVSQFEVTLLGEGSAGGCPIADAAGKVDGGSFGSTVEAEVLEDVELTSAGSQTADGGDVDAYEWSIIELPSGSLATIEPSPSDANPSLTVDVTGTYVVELRVYNDAGVVNCQPATVEIEATPDADITIELSWEAPEVQQDYDGPDPSMAIGTDLDIHYKRDGDEWGGPESVYYAQAYQDWDEHGEPSLMLDSLYGKTPETIFHHNPGDGGLYNVGVHYFCDNAFGEAIATLKVHFGDTLVAQNQETIDASGDFWHAGDISWNPDAGFEFIDDYTDDFDELSNCDGSP